MSLLDILAKPTVPCVVGGALGARVLGELAGLLKGSIQPPFRLFRIYSGSIQPRLGSIKVLLRLT